MNATDQLRLWELVGISIGSKPSELQGRRRGKFLVSDVPETLRAEVETRLSAASQALGTGDLSYIRASIASAKCADWTLSAGDFAKWAAERGWELPELTIDSAPPGAAASPPPPVVLRTRNSGGRPRAPWKQLAVSVFQELWADDAGKGIRGVTQVQYANLIERKLKQDFPELRFPSGGQDREGAPDCNRAILDLIKKNWNAEWRKHS